MASFWQTLIRFDRDKVTPETAFRNTIGVAIPLLAGHLLGYDSSGLVASAGALNVSFTDGNDPYVRRAERMIAASILCCVAVFIGATFGGDHVLLTAIALCWAFAAGLLVAVDQAAADIGTISLVTLVVFAAHPMPAEQAILSGLLALGGGLFQAGLAVALWPIRRYEPERRTLASLYRGLSATASTSLEVTVAPLVTAQMNEAQLTLSVIARDRSMQAERYLILLSQAERIRLSLHLLRRLRLRLEREKADSLILDNLSQYFRLTSEELRAIAVALTADSPVASNPLALEKLNEIGNTVRQACSECGAAVIAALDETMHALDALAGQLRSALELASHATPQGHLEFQRRDARRPIHLRLLGAIPTLRANLTLQSTACRHAIRLAICIALAEGMARSLGWERTYWIPMTAAIILKPDFTSTFSRGVLRLAGTFTGLVLATAFFYLLPVAFETEFVLIVLFTFLLRSYGPANYGIFVTAISALVVALLAVSGVTPGEAIQARAINTVAGGVLALISYAAWPTWERSQAPEVLARLLDAYREYFHEVGQALIHPHEDRGLPLDATRQSARVARTNLEASVDRMAAEPAVPATVISAWSSIIATTHRLIHSFMALEAALTRSDAVPARPAFRRFGNDVEITLHSLSSALRGSVLHPGDLPDLREDHHELLESGNKRTERYALVNIESDRITNSLDTLALQIFQLRSPQTVEGQALTAGSA